MLIPGTNHPWWWWKRMLCEVRHDLILVFCERAWNGMETPTITYVCFYSPQELGSFQFIREKFRVQISWANWEAMLSQHSHRSSWENTRRREGGEQQTIYGYLLLCNAVVNGNSIWYLFLPHSTPKSCQVCSGKRQWREEMNTIPPKERT